MISGLVVHLRADERLAEESLRAIEAEPAIEIGQRVGARLPIVLECDSRHESQSLTDWLLSLPGVAHVDVTFVHLESPIP